MDIKYILLIVYNILINIYLTRYSSKFGAHTIVQSLN